MKEVESSATANYDSNKSVLYSATLAEKFKDRLYAEVGWDVSLIDIATTSKIENAEANLSIKRLATPAMYSLVIDEGEHEESSKIICTVSIYCGVEIQVQHGWRLMICNFLWMFTGQLMGEPLLGYSILKALRLNTKETLGAARDRLQGKVDLLQLTKSDPETEGNENNLSCFQEKNFVQRWRE